ncbi:deca-heme c-type cytochrome [Alginatibacterium sediminis]|uniref:Deca-heme c-type cytochrome n=1 Tax=Alginatibacterium sediminis TaxID=2164068 RepID=A0A420E7M7_9ALTE|nr:multiheme c-type cytochrome [Alginatibacterium sediminis]RKF13722.1 deca-heme c-type cytochrome [Alginatibacterium sediminis]
MTIIILINSMLLKAHQMHVFLILISLFLFIFPTSTYAYVGSEQCIECHATEYEQWQGSHHDMSMRHMDDDAVLGDFDDVSFEFYGKTNRFFRKGEQYWVNIEGPDGEFADYQISYTFGWKPLQQYMVEFPDGRVQLIPFAWDSRTTAEGGQTWFHLYPQFTDKKDDFFWTNPGQNWNFMCADCHSTNLQKNYDLENNTYASTWSEINVACEACHGPAEDHMLWSKSNDELSSSDDHAGFRLNLAPQVQNWVYQEGSSTLVPESQTASQQTSMCAQCHSRRLQLTEENPHLETGNYSDRYRLNLVSDDLYHLDGQIYDEDYVYGSFLQSKMASSGVVCTDCHNPHTAELKLPEQVLCNQCHLPDGYSDENHSKHQTGTEGAQCTSCHMPETTYMQVDPRRDHSWQIPRPDLSQQIGTPNVCVDCHNTPEEGNQWAIDTLKQWFPNSPYQGQDHFAQAFAQAAIGDPNAASALSYQAQDINNAGIIRASALERIANYPSRNALVALSRAIRGDDELMRLASVAGSANYQPADRWRLLSPLLNDPVLVVRSETASVLAQDWRDLTNEQRDLLSPALDEYLAIARFNSDRAFGRVNTANVHLYKSELSAAEQAYKGAIMVEPYAALPYINLADLYRAMGDNQRSLSQLKTAIDLTIEDADLDFAYAMSLVRVKDYPNALQQLKNATERDPQNPQYWYTLGLLSRQLGDASGINALKQAYQTSQQPQYLYALCEAMIQDRMPNATTCVEQFATMGPANAVEQLKSMLSAP